MSYINFITVLLLTSTLEIFYRKLFIIISIFQDLMKKNETFQNYIFSVLASKHSLWDSVLQLRLIMIESTKCYFKVFLIFFSLLHAAFHLFYCIFICFILIVVKFFHFFFR